MPQIWIDNCSPVEKLAKSSRHRLLTWLMMILVTLSVVWIEKCLLAQTADDSSAAYARTPKEIAFQNDSQWEDNRVQESDVGPFFAASIKIAGQLTLKGLAVRVGDQGQAAICFDTARMRLSAAWTGDFLAFEPRRFGLIAPPEAAGKIAFTTEKQAGWSWHGRFEPVPDEITLPMLEEDYTAKDTSETSLPDSWAKYRGLFTHGRRIILDYTVGTTAILESPWYIELENQHAFVRSLEIGPSDEPLELWVADRQSQIVVIQDGSSAQLAESQPVLTIAPRAETVRVKLLILDATTSSPVVRALRDAADTVENLTEMVKTDAGRYPEQLQTQGTTADSGGPYVIDTLTLPFENPWKALLFTAGHDFFLDGTGAVCTVHGDVWTVSGIDRELQQLVWRRFATGLHQPLGLKIVDDKVYVVGRNQITRLHDRNGDGEADYYENLNNDLFITPRAHDFVACLETDPEGNFYFIHAKTGVMRLSRDGDQLTAIADGFRNPNGLGVSPGGLITAAPQQGTWTPESSIIAVRPGGYYGFGGPRVTDERPAGWELPLCFIPRAMDNSGGGQIWVPDDRWGPLAGNMLHFSFGQCRMLLTLTESVQGTLQGGTITFPTEPADFESGSMRGRFHPQDGQLYVSGLRGWQTRAIRDGCLQRVRYTGEAIHLPIAVKTYTNGIQLTFADPLDREMAENPDNFFAEQWNYRWSEEYGSPDYSVSNPAQQGRDEVSVLSATLLDDQRTLFLEMPELLPVHQLSIHWLLESQEGTSVRGQYAHTINTRPQETFSSALIHRRISAPLLADDVQARLVPGVIFGFSGLSTPHTDARSSRLAALRQSMAEPCTPFMPIGPFQLDMAGWIRVPLSGFYNFRVESTGPATLSINGAHVFNGGAMDSSAEPLLLRKGFNKLQLSYASPQVGEAVVQLKWKGEDFDWEPISPALLYHDPRTPELAYGMRRRQARQLFAESRCAACHITELEADPMFEMTLAAPSLANIGQRVSGAWLKQWIQNPRTVRRSSHMPAVFENSDDSQQQVADIVAFLQSLPISQQVSNDSSGSVEFAASQTDGEKLFETLGCLGCHDFSEPSLNDSYDRVSLYYVNSKYPDDALINFLSNPHAYDTGSSMPDFHLKPHEANSLAMYLREQSFGILDPNQLAGDAVRGKQLFAKVGCAQCHLTSDTRMAESYLSWKNDNQRQGCLSATAPGPGVPHYQFSDEERASLRNLLANDLPSLNVSHASETSDRLVNSLRCASCHDRDGVRSSRPLIIAEEGSGLFPEVLPDLTQAGEKFHADWTKKLLKGEAQKPRPWISSRMPSFESYADALANGMAAEHAIAFESRPKLAVDAQLAEVGEQLTRQTGLDCRQCHAIGDLQPRGDKETQVALGINFEIIRERLRGEAYHRFMLDPPRYEANTKMIRLSENGLTTKLKVYFDADARQQFNAIWHYIQSLPLR